MSEVADSARSRASRRWGCLLAAALASVASSGCALLVTDERASVRFCAESPGTPPPQPQDCQGPVPHVFFQYETEEGGIQGPVRAGELVYFTAFAVASNRGCCIDTYAWDVNGGGQFDDALGSKVGPFSYVNSGNYLASVRVTDDAGEVAVSTQLLEVRPGEGAGAEAAHASSPDAMGAGAPAARPRRFSATLSLATLKLGELQTSPKALEMVGQVLVGELNGNLRKANSKHSAAGSPPLKPLLSSTWLTETSATLRRKDDVLSSRGLALATFLEAAGAACVRYSLTAENGRGRGRMRVLGGTGEAETLAATARFHVRARAPTELRLRGTITSRRTSPRGLPVACEELTADL